MNNNLLALQNTQKLMDMTQERLATGLKVNSAIDNPSAYFTAQGLNQRAGDLSALLDSMGQGIQTVKAANEGIESITKFVELAKGVVNQFAEGGDAVKLEAQYTEIMAQIDAMALDSGYKGKNLLNGDTLTVYFNEGRTSSLDIVGGDYSADGIGMIAWDDTAGTGVDAMLDGLDAAISYLRAGASDFSNNYSILTNREEFTDNLVNVLTEGADKLTLADMNEEAANMLALQTRQQLGVNSLSLASQAQQSVLKLF